MTRLDELELSVRTAQALEIALAGIPVQSAEELPSHVSVQYLQKLRRVGSARPLFGQRSLKELREQLGSLGVVLPASGGRGVLVMRRAEAWYRLYFTCSPSPSASSAR